MARIAWSKARPARPHGRRPLALLALTLASASCVPVTGAVAPAMTVAAADLPAMSAAPAALPPVRTMPASAAAPITRIALQGMTPVDRLRALDCLAQAVYYEARSESEDGQRAVAQVVLNRVRHPAWPDSVCGVVYQGPLRAGGGCQFTFTCDGSLALAPQGESWARARRIATEALAGRGYAPVGLATHYHTFAVSPSWAPRLALTRIVGAHIFYSLPGRGGLATAFTAAYAGHEPVPVPSPILFRAAGRPMPTPGLAALTEPAPVATQAAAAISYDIPTEARVTSLPDSTVRAEYRQSGQWRADAPAAITGAR